MRETQFIKQNQEKWAEFESTLKGEAKDADRLRDLFVQITDDLAYSRTFYPNRSVRVYLNGLAQRVYLKLYKSRKKPLAKLLSFWTDDLPQEVYKARMAFRLAFFAFCLSFAIGMLSCAMDTEFAEVILGQDYVEMTRANIESGDPMAVYKERGSFNMFLGITFNNLSVAFLAFAMGVFFGIGSLMILISNAIMVGCFQYFFVQHGLFVDSFLTIWIHGTLEISAIVIASAAGITMGRGPAFPGTYTRMQAFRQSARRGAKIMLGTAPLFIIAGFLEGYMTRQTETPNFIRASFIILCLLFVIIYFIWYPWYRHKMGLVDEYEKNKPIPPSRFYSLDTGKIRSHNEIFNEVFLLLRRHLSWILGAILGGALLYTTVIYALSNTRVEDIAPFATESWIYYSYNFVLLYVGVEGEWLVTIMGGLMIYLVGVCTMTRVQKELGRKPGWKAYLHSFYSVILIYLFAYQLSFSMMIVVIFVMPLFLLFSNIHFNEELTLSKSISRLFTLLRGAYFSSIGLSIFILVMGIILFSLSNSIVVEYVFKLINWLVTADQSVLDQWSIYINTFVLASIANFIWALLFLGFSILYFTLREINQATALSERLTTIGSKGRIKGLDRE